MHELAVGTILQKGKYIIESVLGQGSFGITYLATTKMHGPLGEISVKVALKEFFARDLNTRHQNGSVCESGSGSLSDKYSKDFLRESRNLSRLSHRGIIRIFDSFQENNTHYYVMEYLDGGSLDAYIQSKGHLGESETLVIAGQIAEALSFMHSNKMLHLDLKPKNVMRRSDGSICLIDFGLSKQYESSGEPESSTTIGLGTPGYAPLEQGSTDERKNFAPTLDVYALGGTMFKMLTGKTPPRASDIMNEGFPSAELSAFGVSSKTLSLIACMMSPRRKERPQSIADCGLTSAKPKRMKQVNTEDTRVFDEETVSETLINHSEQLLKQQSLPRSESSYKRKLSAIFVGILLVILIGCGACYFEWRRLERETEMERIRQEQIEKEAAERAEKERQQKAEADRRAARAKAERERVEREQKERELASQAVSYSDGILKVNEIEYPMIYVSGGSFDMGSDDNGAIDDEKPVHCVTLSSYRIGKYEVTQDIWEAIMGNNPSSHKDSRRPVENVSCDECKNFISKLNKLTGQNFRLPNESEWEFAARGGNNSMGYKYSGSDTIGDVAWYYKNSDSTTQKVGMKTPNELGICDMTGNVWEWCDVGYVIRGGSCSVDANRCRVSFRVRVFTSGSSNSRLGFRLCL